MRYEVNAVMNRRLARPRARLQLRGELPRARGLLMLRHIMRPRALVQLRGGRAHARRSDCAATLPVVSNFGAGHGARKHIAIRKDVTPKGALQPMKCNASATREGP